MAMQPRERRLAAVVGVMGLTMIGWYAASGLSRAFQLRNATIAGLERELQQKQFQVLRGAEANERFAEWERRSLPRDREVARTLYQSKLVASLSDARLTNVQVEPGRSVPLRDVYVKLPYTVRAQGGIGEIGTWLAAFFQADDLHQIRDLSIQPIGTSSMLQLAATIETLSLPGADRADRLTESTGSRLNAEQGAKLAGAIAERRPFAAYVPPAPPKPPAPVARVEPPPPAPPQFDEARHTFLTSVVAVDAEHEAWLVVRPTNQLIKLRVGDGFRVGQFDGNVVRIGAEEIEIEQDGKRRVVALGKPLSDVGSTAAGSL